MRSNKLVIKKKRGIFKSSWKWSLVSKNGRVLTNAWGFDSKQMAEKNINLVKNIFNKGDYETVEE